MEKLEIEIVKFLNKCDSNFKTGIYNYNDVKKAQELLCKLKKSPNQKNAIYLSLIHISEPTRRP